LNERQVEGLFNIFDRKNRGIVSFADFHSILNRLGYAEMNENPSEFQAKEKAANLGFSPSLIRKTR